MKKSKTRIFVSKNISANLMLYIKNKQHHFLKNVMRVKINDIINVFDGKSGEWETSVISINRDNTVLRVMKNIKEFENSPDAWLIFSPIKLNRMAITIQKSTELGVSKIIPCVTEFTNFKNVNISNLTQNAIEAAEQSQRLDIPQIEETTDLVDIISKWPEDRLLVFCNEINRSNNIIEKLLEIKNQYTKYAVLIGPEGGFSEKENQMIIESNKALEVSLGKRVLRSDTASTVALFCLQEILK